MDLNPSGFHLIKRWRIQFRILLLPLLLILLLSPCDATNLSIELQQEADSLLTFSSALVDAQKSISSWKTHTSPCNWKHVICDSKNQRIIGIDLSGAGLQGNLSKEIANLKHLKYLNLKENQLIGSIPSELSKLASLEYLDLSSNFLEGVIPSEFSSLHLLKHLDLGQNTLKGSIPHGICSFPHLEYLSLNSNDLTGNLPTDFLEMKRIQHLDLAFNFITDTLSPDIGKFSSLKYFDLTSNNFSGSIPSSLGGLPLEVLNLGMNLFSGELPSEIPKIWTLYSLRLSFNSLTGEISPLFGKLPNLTFFHLTNNEFYGTIPLELGSPPLIELLLGYNNLTGTIPTSVIENLADTLQLLELSFNQLTGGIPPQLTLLKNVRSIDISNNFLTGNIPEGFGSIPDLVLALGYNDLTGNIPTDLVSSDKIFFLSLNQTHIEGTLPEFNCSNLFSLELAGNRLKGELPSFGHCNLNELHLQGNNFTGDIPSLPPSLSILNLQENRFSGFLPDFTNFKSLNTVNICCNELTGSIPFSLTQLPSLVLLDISSNMLEGHLPLSLFDMPELLFLNASYNRFSGSLPTNFSCPKITSIFLRGNDLQGNIPSSFFKLQYVQYLDFRDNTFSGAIPSQFSHMPYLISLYLSGNKFNGTIPSSLAKLNTLRVLDASNNSLSGDLPLDISGWSLSLTKLKLSHNSISGKFPSQYGNLARLKELDFSSNQLEGKLPPELSKLKNVLVLNVSKNKLSGEIPSKFGNLSSLERLDLSVNRLDGEIPHHLGDLKHLGTLFVSENDLIGPINEYILSLPNLIHFNASYNRLEGFVNQIFVEKFGRSAFEHNSNLCGAAFGSVCTRVGSNLTKGKGSLNIPHILIIAGGVFLLLLVLSVFIIRMRLVRLRKKLAGGFGELELFDKLECSVKVQDIILATDGFSKKNMIGSGGFGEVYRAFLPDGKTQVAVKRLINSGQQGEREFLAEMQTLGGLRHRHLVRLIGAYSEPSGLDRFLIYEYMAMGSLDILFEPDSSVYDPRLRKWDTRLNIALGVALGLKYLHHDCKPRIIHRDLKPSNILLDKDLIPHIADFGLARTINPLITHLSTSACGTVGYMSLEYARKGKATEKSDVYAYGIVLLQLVTGKRPTDETFAYEGLRLWAATNPTFGILDWKLESDGCMQQILGMLRLGLLCTSNSPAERPSMIEIVHVLQNLKEFASGIGFDPRTGERGCVEGEEGQFSGPMSGDTASTSSSV